MAIDPNAAQNNPGPNGSAVGEFSKPTEGLSPLTGFKEDEFKTYKYPLNYNLNQDRIHIYQLKYVRTGVVQTETQIKNYKELSGSVTLPMPNDITETNSVGWGEDSLSNAAALLMGPLTQGAVGISDVNLGQLKESAGSLGNVLKRGDIGMRVQQTLVTRAAASLIGKLGIQVNPEAYITRATGAAINPNMELLFSGPKLRQFAFQFKMTPRSLEEAKQIRGIIRFFKKGMSPKRSTDQNTSFFLGTPNVFKIKFVSGDNENELKSIGKIKTCALVSFSANYTPDGFYAAYSDQNVGSQPVAVTIQLGFTELTPVFNDEYGEDDVNDIGPNSFTTDYNVLNLNTSTSQQPSTKKPLGRSSSPVDTIGESNPEYRNPRAGERSAGAQR